MRAVFHFLQQIYNTISEHFSQNLRGLLLVGVIDVGVDVGRGTDVGMPQLELGQLQAAGLRVENRSDQMAKQVLARGPLLTRHSGTVPQCRIDPEPAQRVGIDRRAVGLHKDEVLRRSEGRLLGLQLQLQPVSKRT